MSQRDRLGDHSPRLAELRELRTKAGRRERRRYTAEGRTMIAEALRSGATIEAIYATEKGFEELGDLAERSGAACFSVSDRALSRASDLETPPGAIAVLFANVRSLDDVLAAGAPALVLADVADPGNAGTLLRSAEIFGVRSAIFTRASVEPYNPKVVRASMGAIFRVGLAVCEASDLLRAAERERYAVVAADREGMPLPDFRWPERSLIAIGNERRGVSGVLPRWDFGVAIPQPGEGESLNAAIAGSIVLYAFSLRASANDNTA